ncbi:FUSC family protein [Kribbella sp. CWNU-51]
MLARRTVVAVAAIVILSVPFAVFAAISGQVTASSWAPLGGVVALTNLMIGGRAIAYLSVGLLTALTPVAIVSGAVPVAGAGLMAIMCFGVGLSAAQGLHRGMLLIPMYLAFMIITPPPWSGQTVDRTSTSYLLWNMLFLGGGALWAALVFPPLLRKQKMPPRPEPWSRADTLVYTTTITVLCTASTLGVLIWWPGSNGAWLVLTLLVVTQFGADTHLKRTLGRVAGTVAGVVIAAIVASVSSSEVELLAIGLVLLVITVVIMLGPHSYVLYSIFITPRSSCSPRPASPM